MNRNRLEKLAAMQKAYPNDPFIPYAIGLEYLGEGHYMRSIAYFERVISEHPDYLPAYYQTGVAYESVGLTDDARKVILKGIDLAVKKNEKKTCIELEELLERL
jgi:tetratricopeptide (TPR) repeat protein